jgi:hypothetical protein
VHGATRCSALAMYCCIAPQDVDIDEEGGIPLARAGAAASTSIPSDPGSSSQYAGTLRTITGYFAATYGESLNVDRPSRRCCYGNAENACT